MDDLSSPRRDDRPTHQPHTHTVWACQRLGRKTTRMLECGSGCIDAARNTAFVVMNRQPLGGYTGYIVLSPKGVTPQPPKPERSNESDDDSSE